MVDGYLKWWCEPLELLLPFLLFALEILFDKLDFEIDVVVVI